MKVQGLSKHERIVSRKLTEQLFNSGQGQSLVAFPLRAVYMPVQKDIVPEQEDVAVQVLMSVSKRHFKHAVDRNRIKRQLREAYRKNKHLLLGSLPQGQSVAVAFLWLSDGHLSSDNVEKRMKSLLHRIRERLQPKQESAN